MLDDIDKLESEYNYFIYTYLPKFENLIVDIKDISQEINNCQQENCKVIKSFYNYLERQYGYARKGNDLDQKYNIFNYNYDRSNPCYKKTRKTSAAYLHKSRKQYERLHSNNLIDIQDDLISKIRRKENIYNLSLDDIKEIKEITNNTCLKDTTFSQDVINYCYKQGITRGVDFEEETHLSQNIFSKLLTKDNYIPDKRICVSICIGLRLDIEETQSLLQKAGFTLSKNIDFDKVIIHCINTRYYKINNINKILKEYNIKERIGTIERNKHYFKT